MTPDRVDGLRAAAADAAYGPDTGTDNWPDTEVVPLPVAPPTISRHDDWRDRAACANTDPALFFPEGSSRNRQTQYDHARHICATCTARTACLQYALVNHETEGMWGGTTPKQRRTMRPQTSGGAA